MDNKEILVVKNLTVAMKDRFLLKNISFSMKQGECIGVVGEKKSGKTSLIKALSGALPITEGKVLINGINIKNDKMGLKQVGFCYDPPVFFKFQTVYDNLSFITGLSGHTSKEKIVEALHKFNLGHKIHSRVFFLSYKEKKLMSFALAYITEPKLLFVDEPYKGLSPAMEKIVRNYFAEIKANGTAIVISSNDFETVDGECDEYIFMEKREIKKILSAKECQNLSTLKTYSYVEVKFPHFAGKTLIEKFGLDVKILHKKVLFEADFDQVAEIVKFLTINKFAVYKAGRINRKSETIFANLTPYYKKEES